MKEFDIWWYGAGQMHTTTETRCRAAFEAGRRLGEEHRKALEARIDAWIAEFGEGRCPPPIDLNTAGGRNDVQRQQPHT